MQQKSMIARPMSAERPTAGNIAAACPALGPPELLLLLLQAGDMLAPPS
jgi:hypothetical protein